MPHRSSSPPAPRPFCWRRAPEEIRAPIHAESACEDIETWILSCIAFRLGVDPLSLDPREPPHCYGFTRDMAAQLTRDLARWLGQTLPEDLFDGSADVSTVARLLARGRSLADTPSAPLVPVTAELEAPPGGVPELPGARVAHRHSGRARGLR